MARIVQYKISFMEKRQESNSNRSSLGLDISIAAYKVIAIDPPKVRQLKEAIKKLDEVLKSGYTYENPNVCLKFPEIIFAQQSEITRTTEDFLRSQSRYVQYESLKAIRLVLYDAVKAGKAIQAFEQPVSFTPTKFMYKKKLYII